MLTKTTRDTATGAALGSGLVGALALTLVHETVRQVIDTAPRMDLMGMQAIKKGMRRLDLRPPSDRVTHKAALLGDVLSNSIYYSLVGFGNGAHIWRRGALLGLSAGLGALLLPKPLGLSRRPSSRTNATKVMTVGWYLIGGLTAAAALQLYRTRTR